MYWLESIYTEISFVELLMKLGHLVSSCDFDAKCILFCYNFNFSIY